MARSTSTSSCRLRLRATHGWRCRRRNGRYTRRREPSDQPSDGCCPAPDRKPLPAGCDAVWPSDRSRPRRLPPWPAATATGMQWLGSKETRGRRPRRPWSDDYPARAIIPAPPNRSGRLWQRLADSLGRRPQGGEPLRRPDPWGRLPSAQRYGLESRRGTSRPEENLTASMGQPFLFVDDLRWLSCEPLTKFASRKLRWRISSGPDSKTQLTELSGCRVSRRYLATRLRAHKPSAIVGA